MYSTYESHTHGGKRPGAGRPPREDDRHLRLLRIRLTDQEHIAVLMLSTDERRKVLLEAVKQSQTLTDSIVKDL